MKKFEFALLKLRYDEHGRLFVRSFQNVRTDNIKYYSKKEDEFFKTYNHDFDIIALWDMKKDELFFYRYPLTRKTYMSFYWYSSIIVRYPFELSDFMKRYIKAQR